MTTPTKMPLLFPLLCLFALLGLAAAQASEKCLQWYPAENDGAFPGARLEKFGAPKVEKDSKLGAVLVFDGKQDALVVHRNPVQGDKAFTVEILFQPSAGGPKEQRFFHVQDVRERRLLCETRLDDKSQWCLDSHLFESQKVYTTLIDFKKVCPPDAWYWVATVFEGGKVKNYINGVLQNEGQLAFNPMEEGRFSLGMRLNQVHWFKGKVRELRFHHEALKPGLLQRVIP